MLLIAFIGSSIYIAVQPNEISFSRTKTVEAPQEVVYNYLNNLNHWNSWVPWKKISTTDSNQNSKEYTWLQDNSIGRITTIKSSKPTSIHQELIYHEYPKSELDWKIDSISENTSSVTLSMTSKNIPLKKKVYYAIFGTPEIDLAPKFEKGLIKLDSAIIESMKAYSVTINGITNHSGSYYLYNTTSSRIDNYKDKAKVMMAEVTKYISENQIPMAGFPFISFSKWDREHNSVTFSCCIPTTTEITTTDNTIKTGLLPGFKTLKTTLKGNYNYLDEAWNTTSEYMITNDLEKAESNIMLESYVTNPKYKINPADWVTEIYVAIKQETDSIPQIPEVTTPVTSDN